MVNKNTIIAIILIMVAITLIGLGVVIAFKDMTPKDTSEDSIERLYVIEANNAYGVMNSKGKIVAQPQFSKIARINNIIYLKANNTSYLYNLITKETITLDGVESDILYIKGENGFLDKFILQYGETTTDAVYRIIDATGKKVTDKDFASINAIYSYLELVEPDNFTPKDAKETTLNSAEVAATLSYPTKDGKSQYIVKKTENGTIKYGIVDENNKQIIEPVFDKIEQIKDSNKACTAIKDNLNYVILDNGTSIETEPGFEFDYNKDGYVIQKRGTTGNKIYNLSGDVIVDKIFTYPAKLATLNSANAKYLLMQDEKTNLWSMYNMDTAQKLDAEFSNLVVDYLYEKDINVINTSFMYKNATSLVGVDLSDFSTFNINIVYTVVSPLESGTKVNISTKADQNSNQ